MSQQPESSQHYIRSQQLESQVHEPLAGSQHHISQSQAGSEQPRVDVGITPPATPAMKEPVKASTFFLEHSGQAFQSFAPLHAIHAHQCAFHRYHDDPGRQVEAHHYCSHLSENVMQCVIYDACDTRSAKLIGVEYVIGHEVFATLPDEEKQYWHPHVYEVQSGLITLPGVPNMAEDKIMARLINTYGKTWHMWQVDRGDTLPIGPAKLMSTFYKPEDVNWDMVKKRDLKYGLHTEDLAKRRADMAHAPIDPKANA